MANVANLDTSTRLDITCRRGDTFELDLDVKSSEGTVLNVSSSEYTFHMEVRTADTEDTETLTEDAIVLSTRDSSDTNNKQITVDQTGGANGDLKFKCTASNMKRVASGLYVYDIQADDGSSVTTWLRGIFKVNEDITI